MSLNSADKKKLARKRAVDEMLLCEYEGYAHFIIGKVKKIGREKVLKSYKTAFTATEHYWLKKEYEKLMDHCQEIKLKQIPTTLAGDKEAPIRVIFRATPDPA